ncbi:MAG: N-acetylmuramoyl-L-alanine amidase, partial [Rhodocyclaceae bacterium]
MREADAAGPVVLRLRGDGRGGVEGREGEEEVRYPEAEWVPWKYLSEHGQTTYFKGQNRPEAAVLHIAQGYASTARQWAITGHYGASWHFFVCRDGHVMQHLDFEDGGYHAGIEVPPAPEPIWPLWKGAGININTYTIGIEHEGFSGDGFT